MIQTMKTKTETTTMDLIQLRNSLPNVLAFREALPAEELIFFDTELRAQDVEADRTQWLFVLPVGKTVYVDPSTDEKHEIDLSEDFLKVSATEFRRATYNFFEAAPEGKTPYTFPALKEHKAEGDRFGDLLDAQIRGNGDVRGLYVKVQWSESTWEKIQKGDYKFVSVRIDQKYADELGNEYGPIIKEVSITANPRIKRIGSIQDALTFSDGEVMTKTELEQMLAETKAQAKAEALEEFRAEQAAAQTQNPDSGEGDEGAPTTIQASEEDDDQNAVGLAPGSNAPANWNSDNLADKIIARMQQQFDSNPNGQRAARQFSEIINGSSGGSVVPNAPTAPRTPDLVLAEAITEKKLVGEEAVIYALENADVPR
jgi:hypothetical protein